MAAVFVLFRQLCGIRGEVFLGGAFLLKLNWTAQVALRDAIARVAAWRRLRLDFHQALRLRPLQIVFLRHEVRDDAIAIVLISARRFVARIKEGTKKVAVSIYVGMRAMRGESGIGLKFLAANPTLVHVRLCAVLGDAVVVITCRV